MTFQNITIGLLWLFILATPFELRLSLGGVSIPGLLGYLSLAAGLLAAIWTNKLVKPSVGYLLLLGFCMWSTLSIAWSDYPDRSVIKVMIYWGLLGFVALVNQYASSGAVRLKLLAGYVLGCWCGVISLLFSYISGTRYMGLSGRYSSAFGDPNYLALALVIGIPIAFYTAANETKAWRKVLLMAYVPAAIAAVIVTASRGGALSMAAALLVYGALNFHKIHKVRLIWVAGAFALIVGMVYVLPPDAIARIETIPTELHGGDLDGRKAYWDIGTALIVKHPIRGVGSGAGDGNLTYRLGIERVFHSTGLEVMTDVGAVGVMLFYGAFLWSIFSLAIGNYPERAVLLAISAAWLIGSSSLSWEWHKVTWFVFALLVSAVPQKRLAKARASARVERYGHNNGRAEKAAVITVTQ